MDKVNELVNTELVSVLVLSFRSSGTIVETLQSIYNQTYKNIELVISDDASDDNTVEIIEQWVAKCGERFKRVEVIVSKENTGTSKNMNRGVDACRGEWIKPIAADDLLSPECVQKYMEKVHQDKGQIQIYQADEEVIDENSIVTGYMTNESQRMRKLADMKTAEEQYQYFLFNDIKVSPTMLFSRKAFYEVGMCDERIRNIEDYPLKLRFLRNGFRMGYLKCSVVQYRVHNSISHRKNEVCPINHVKQRRVLKELCCYPYIPKSNIFYWSSEILERFQENVIIHIFRNKPGFLVKCFMKVMSYLIPRQWERRMTAWKEKR